MPLEKTLTFHNVIIHIKSVWNKDPNNCYYNILLEKYSYELPKDNDDNKYFLFNKSIDVNNTNESKECDICHYWYFLDKRFNFQPDVCNGCNDVLMSINLNDIAILNIHDVYYRCIIIGISKIKAINLMQNIDSNY